MKPKATPAPDWRTGTGYTEHGERTDLWGWEFLRRNPEYRAAWQRLAAITEELRADYGKPCMALPGEWEGQEKDPYCLVGRAFAKYDTRATAFDPPRNKGESEKEWIRRIHAGGGQPRMTPISWAMGSEWGLEVIADPALPRLGLMHRWEIAPFGVTSPGAHRHNDEFVWVHALKRLAEILRPDPLPRAALREARAMLDKVPAAWEKRFAEMAEESHPEKRGRFVVEFDLRVSIPEQLRHAGDQLANQKDLWTKDGGEVWDTGRKNKETPGYSTYLRVLDAIEEIGEADGTRLRKEIAEAMIAGYKPKAQHDERKRYIARAATWIERAKELRDDDYRRLVAIAVKPTYSECQNKRRK